MKRLNRLFEQRGQTQIAAAAIMASVMLTAAIYSLERSSIVRVDLSKNNKRIELKNAVESAIRYVAHLYQSQASCDPVFLNQLLGRLSLSGGTTAEERPTIAVTAPATGSRQFRTTVNGNVYNVSIGPVNRLVWNHDRDAAGPNPPTIQQDPSFNVDPVTSLADYVVGYSQDAVVQAWASSGDLRVTQWAVLINNCGYPSGYAMMGSPVTNWSVAYHQITGITGAADYGPLGTAGSKCNANDRYYGTIRNASEVGVEDLLILKNYISTHNSSGASSAAIVTGGGGITSCVDFNRDGRVDEVDLNVMEKLLRGYIYNIPVNK